MKPFYNACLVSDNEDESDKNEYHTRICAFNVIISISNDNLRNKRRLSISSRFTFWFRWAAIPQNFVKFWNTIKEYSNSGILIDYASYSFNFYHICAGKTLFDTYFIHLVRNYKHERDKNEYHTRICAFNVIISISNDNLRNKRRLSISSRFTFWFRWAAIPQNFVKFWNTIKEYSNSGILIDYASALYTFNLREVPSFFG